MAAPEHDWYLHAWFETLGKVQNDLHTQLGYHKNTMNRLWHGDQPYRKDIVNKIAAWLEIRPHELLMHPEDAFRARRLENTFRSEARRLTAISQEPADTPVEEPSDQPRRRAS